MHKYKLNEKVYLIKKMKEEKFIICKSCNGKGLYIDCEEKNQECPRCYGRGGKTEWLDYKWMIQDFWLTIGQIKIEITNLHKTCNFDNIGVYKEGETKINVRYMCYETGVGSGNVYFENDLFPTLELAEKECKKRNLEGE